VVTGRLSCDQLDDEGSTQRCLWPVPLAVPAPSGEGVACAQVATPQSSVKGACRLASLRLKQEVLLLTQRIVERWETLQLP